MKNGRASSREGGSLKEVTGIIKMRHGPVVLSYTLLCFVLKQYGQIFYDESSVNIWATT
jgi:hypothetical protein